MFGTNIRTGAWVAGALAATSLATAAVGQFSRGYSYASGKEIYEHICQGCHMPDAKGAQGAGAYPALAGDRNLSEPMYPAMVILTGQKAMPSFSELDDAQVDAVVNYVRGNFGNRFKGTLTIEQVKTLRASAVHQDALAPG